MKNVSLLILKVMLIIPFLTFGQKGDIRSQLEEIAAKHKAVGLAVAVVKDNQIVYRHALGYADLETGERLNMDHLFRIASISKSFSSTAIMQLVEERKLSLDDDFGDLVGFAVRNPKFPDEKITLRMVLSHTSSISDKNGYFNFDVINPEKNENWKNCYNDYKPGDKYEYCNLNFNMIGAVIERMSGNRFDIELKRRVLDPLKLIAGFCVDSLDRDRFAQLYDYDRESQKFTVQPMAYHPRREELKNYVLGYTTPVFSPTGGLKISANDLTRYMMMHMNYGQYNGKKLISAESAAEMQKALSGSGYGLALTNTKNVIEGVPLVGHTGDAYGLHSNMYFDPVKKYGFIVITNGCDVKYDAHENVLLSKEVVNCLYNYYIKEPE